MAIESKTLKVCKSKTKLENLFTKPKRSEISIPIPRCKVSKPISLPRPKNHIIGDRINRDNRTLYESRKESCYEPVRVGNFYSNSYTDHKSNSERVGNFYSNKILNMKVMVIKMKLSIKKYLDKIKPHLKAKGYHIW